MPRLFAKAPFAALFVFAAGAIAANQSAQQPIFSGRSDLVLVDVVVTDKVSRPVRGLTVADFTVKEDGAVRPIVAFEAVEGGHRAIRSGDRPQPGDAVLNAAPEDASVAFLIDEQHLTIGQAAAAQSALRTAITSLSAREATAMIVAPASKVSVAAKLPFSAGRLVAATYQVKGRRAEDRGSFPIADHEALRIVEGDQRALARVAARFSAINPDLSDGAAAMFARTRATETADSARRRGSAAFGVALLCLDWLKDRPGRRQLVIISSGIARDATDDRYKALIARSLQLNVPVHFVDARTLMGTGRYQGAGYLANVDRGADEGTSARSDESAGLDQLAGETGGLTVGGTNDLGDAMQRLVEAMSSYYVLAYQPPAKGKAGFRTIAVTTSRAGAVVRARRGYESR